LAGNPHAIMVAKQLTVGGPVSLMDEAFARMTTLSNELFESDDAHEGMTAFLEKRPASWVQSLSQIQSD
jgi:enoyl-CoA hydratase/carnithine racemase